MIKSLLLKNLILVEEALVSFDSGLTVITGETGAGKTALVEAIRLILGERADASKVRKGCEKALIQASLDITLSPPIRALFEETGLATSPDEDLILSREINVSGKSRSFIAGQMVPASLLQKLAPHLIDFIGQHAQVSLKSSESQRELLDLFAETDLASFQELWEREKQLESEIRLLEEKKKTSDQREALLEEHLNELNQANLTKGEDEALFEEYTLLANSQELLSTAHQILAQSEEAIEKSTSISPLLDSIVKYSPDLSEVQKMAKEAHLQLTEIAAQMQSFQAKVESDPSRLEFLEERLKLLEHLKKKYGKDLFHVQEEMQKELASIDSLDETIEALSKQLDSAKEKTTLACQAISSKRKEKGLELGKILSKSLQELNIPAAEVTIAITPTPRSRLGEDSICFFLRANLGEKPVPVKESSSGGELSRLLFSVKVALAEKSSPQTMVFDEIDANVGGETATIIGKRLKELGTARQVLCITHFPQVARQGNHHLRVHKEERGNRTICRIDPVNESDKEAELLRMLGGQTPLTTLA